MEVATQSAIAAAAPETPAVGAGMAAPEMAPETPAAQAQIEQAPASEQGAAPEAASIYDQTVDLGYTKRRVGDMAADLQQKDAYIALLHEQMRNAVRPQPQQPDPLVAEEQRIAAALQADGYDPAGAKALARIKVEAKREAVEEFRRISHQDRLETQASEYQRLKAETPWFDVATNPFAAWAYNQNRNLDPAVHRQMALDKMREFGVTPSNGAVAAPYGADQRQRQMQQFRSSAPVGAAPTPTQVPQQCEQEWAQTVPFLKDASPVAKQRFVSRWMAANQPQTQGAVR